MESFWKRRGAPRAFLGVRRPATTLALLSLAGCGEAALRSVSTGYVGCPSDEITISNDDIGWVQRS